jgi:ABC-2 type transport system ATP-binding protein
MLEADVLSDQVAFINEGRVLALDTPERLKLARGRRAVRIRTRTPDSSVTDQVVDMDGTDADARLQAAMSDGDVLTIHSEEATLEDIFVHFAGRGLDA